MAYERTEKVSGTRNPRSAITMQERKAKPRMGKERVEMSSWCMQRFAWRFYFHHCFFVVFSFIVSWEVRVQVYKSVFRAYDTEAGREVAWNVVCLTELPPSLAMCPFQPRTAANANRYLLAPLQSKCQRNARSCFPVVCLSIMLIQDDVCISFFVACA